MRSTVQPLIVPIARRSIVESATEDGTPEIGFVAPLLRRRLSSLARVVLRVAHDCAHDVADARIVFASRHGELARTTTMLTNLAMNEELSPSLFSMSVLNASTGLFSIVQKNTAPATAISAGNASFGYGLQEACLQLVEEPNRPVLFVYADEPAPAAYKADEPANRPTFALGLLLTSSASTRVSCSAVVANAPPSDELQAQAFVRALDNGEGAWHESCRSWFWQRES